MGAPFIALSLLIVAVMQNVSIWYFGRSPWPEEIRSWKVENPILALCAIAATIEIVFGHFFRKTMAALLRRVEQ